MDSFTTLFFHFNCQAELTYQSLHALPTQMGFQAADMDEELKYDLE